MARSQLALQLNAIGNVDAVEDPSDVFGGE